MVGACLRVPPVNICRKSLHPCLAALSHSLFFRSPSASPAPALPLSLPPLSFTPCSAAMLHLAVLRLLLLKVRPAPGCAVAPVLNPSQGHWGLFALPVNRFVCVLRVLSYVQGYAYVAASCWQESPRDRPSFAQLALLLERLRDEADSLQLEANSACGKVTGYFSTC